MTAVGTGVSISDDMSPIGVAATGNFGAFLDVSPISAGIVTISVPNLVGTAQTANSLAVGVAVTRSDTSDVADYAVVAGVATEATNALACSGNADTATMASGIAVSYTHLTLPTTPYV